VLAVVVVAVLAAWPAAARASEVSAGGFKALAEQAVDSRAALEELREVDAVDGRAVDVAGALEGARGDELDARLARLAASVAEVEASSGGDPSADAREILEQARFHGESVPGPFKGLIERLGELVPDFDWLDDLIPGGRWVMWIVVALLLALVMWVLARGVLTRRIRASTAEAEAAALEAAADPRALEREAAEAEKAGDLQKALRLRFRAGLLRLDARGAIHFRPSISTHEVRRALRSEDFDGLAATFDDVVYGGRATAAEDVEAARRHWPEVVSAAGRRD
jgi:hypothetical protein